MANKKSKAEDSKSQERGMFDHLNAIYTDKSSDYFDSLNASEKKTYNQYMLNRFMSMNLTQALIVDELQQYYPIPDKAHYQFFSDILPRGKRFDKYVKSSKKEKYETWLIEMVADHYHVSKKHATEYLDIYYTQNKDALKTLCQYYGKSEKEIKKLKL